ncbi:BQ5605_C005g03530 [Microbotryum silenes-dioicae]|uniref:BQ5605_C005g03530 protein n=1 Tax=Microbotryum silenes-dioicae TaxID=796604 RepID=A0A2X0MFK7_9BASI|nr:BQ5605_C005g03530 [Microbotryum silenes-dioicae]
MSSTDLKHATLSSPVDLDDGSASSLGDARLQKDPRQHRFRNFLMEELDTEDTMLQVTLYCFLTGFISAICFSATFLWPTFQTGGFVQLSIAVSRLFSGPQPRDLRFETSDKQALTSLLSFLLGVALLGRLGDRLGAKRRGWVMFATFVQALLLVAAAVCVHFSGDSSVATVREYPSWRSPLGYTALGFASASLGLHAITAKRLNTQYGTSVVLTTIWVELVCDPKLFVFGGVKSRDHRAMACASIFVGGLCAGALVRTIGSAGTFGIAAGVRAISCASWAGVRAKARS